MERGNPLHGGLAALRAKAIRVEPPSSGLMRLCVELVGRGPNGKPLVSVAHYYEQNGDLVADPEMTFESAFTRYYPTEGGFIHFFRR